MPFTKAQRANLTKAWNGAAYAQLRDAGVRLLDGGAATWAAHAAHPGGCGDPSIWDCRHFCQPGPVDRWNTQLLDVLDVA